MHMPLPVEYQARLFEGTPMNADDFSRLTKLCRISLSEEEKEKFLKSLSQILEYISQLQDVPTEGVAPCDTVLATLTNVLREDIPGELLPRDLFLANAPSHVGGMIRVPSVLKQG